MIPDMTVLENVLLPAELAGRADAASRRRVGEMHVRVGLPERFVFSAMNLLRQDLCAIARPHLANPSWTLQEAARIGYTALAWPR